MPLNLTYDIQNIDICSGLPVGSPVHYDNPVCPVDCATTAAGIYVVQQALDLATCTLGPPIISSGCVAICSAIPSICQLTINGITGEYSVLNGVYLLSYRYQNSNPTALLCAAAYESDFYVSPQIFVQLSAIVYFQEGAGQLINVSVTYQRTDTSGNLISLCQFLFTVSSSGYTLIDCTNPVRIALFNVSPLTQTPDCNTATVTATASILLIKGQVICFPPPVCDLPPPPIPCGTALPANFKITVTAAGGGVIFSDVVLSQLAPGLYERSYLISADLRAIISLTVDLTGSMSLTLEIRSTEINVALPCFLLQANTNQNNCNTNSLDCPTLTWTITTVPAQTCHDYIPPIANPTPGLQRTIGFCNDLNVFTGPLTIVVQPV